MMSKLIAVNRTYIILIDGILRPLSHPELVYFQNNFSSGVIQLRWAERQVRREEVLPGVSINIEMSEVEWLHCDERPQVRGIRWLESLVKRKLRYDDVDD
jgi:hypothetical protein